jgi:predicted amidophosphoribosyltransferase
MFQNILTLFFPKVCASCEMLLLANEIVICTECRHNLPLTNFHNYVENEAFLKFYGRLNIEFAGALLYFQKKGLVQNLIHKLKYKGHQEIGETLGLWYAEDLKKVAVLQSVDYIIPVPIHKKSLKNALSKSFNIPVLNLILVRNKYAKSQTKKNSLARSEFVSQIFSVTSTSEYQNKHFLLIDDVITTGATLENCGREILKIPGAKLSIVCMAMTKNG